MDFELSSSMKWAVRPYIFTSNALRTTYLRPVRYDVHNVEQRMDIITSMCSRRTLQRTPSLRRTVRASY